jgi:hypothetical protein
MKLLVQHIIALQQVSYSKKTQEEVYEQSLTKTSIQLHCMISNEYYIYAKNRFHRFKCK